MTENVVYIKKRNQTKPKPQYSFGPKKVFKKMSSLQNIWLNNLKFKGISMNKIYIKNYIWLQGGFCKETNFEI